MSGVFGKRILLLGGTGTIGIELTSKLSAEGYSVYVTSRKLRKNYNQVVYLQGNGKDKEFLMRIFSERGYDAIIDLMNYNVEEFRENLSLLLASCCHYIFVSSYRVYGNVINELIAEDSLRIFDDPIERVHCPPNDYSLVKAQQEDLLRVQSERNWTIVRPSISYGKGRFQLGCLEAPMFLGRMNNSLPIPVPFGLLECKTTMTWSGDVAKMIAGLLFKADAMMDDFNVLTSESVAWQEVVDVYQDRFKFEIVEVSIDEYLKLGLSRPQLMFDRLRDRVCDNSKIRALTGLEQNDFTSLRQALANELNCSFLKGDMSTLNRFQGRVDRLLGIRQNLKGYNLKSVFKYLLGRLWN